MKPFKVDRVKARISSLRVIATYINPRSRRSCSALSTLGPARNGIISQRITSTARHCKPFAECIVLTQTPDRLTKLEDDPSRKRPKRVMLSARPLLDAPPGSDQLTDYDHEQFATYLSYSTARLAIRIGVTR